MTSRRAGRSPRSEAGQALVEFSLAIILFVILLLAVFDFGRGIYMFNGVSEAAREIARATSVAPETVPQSSAAFQSALAVQRSIIPGISAVAPTCVDIAGSTTSCDSGAYVKVTVTATYTPVSLLGLTGPIVLTSSSSVQIPRGTP
jgi:Flp pilus assembly protein TadG